MLATLLGISLLSLALPFAAADHAPHGRKHHEIAKRAETSLERRQSFSNARFTYFADGLGACGANNGPNDFIVALNSDQYGSQDGPSQYCFDMITIQVGSQTANAQITDECPGCPYGGLDMSQGLFEYFAPLSEGVLTGSWWFNDGSGGGSSSSSSSSSWTPPPSTTPAWTPPPSPTTPAWTPPTSSWTPPSSVWSSSSSSWTPPSAAWSSSSSSSWTSSPSTSPTPSSSSSSSSSPSPSPSASPSPSSSSSSSSQTSEAAAPTTPVGGDNLEALNQIVINIAGLVVAGAQDQ